MDFKPKESVLESEHGDDLDAIPNADVDNYHGLHANTVLVLASLNFMSFASLLNLVGSGAYARDIAAAVGGSTETAWLAQIVAILTAALGPPISQAADYWGRKWFIVILGIFGSIGSIIISRATSMGMVIAGQVICSLSYGSQPLWYAVASEILPRKFRPAAQGGLNASIGLGGIFALLVGSYLVKNYNEGFRIFWYINAALLAVATAIVGLLYNPPPRPLQNSLTLKEKLNRLDWVGYALLTSGIVLFSMALTWSDNPFSWNNAHILAPFIIGVALLIGLATHQTILKRDGMFHHGLFKNDRNFAIALLCIFVEGMGFFAANGFFPFEVSVLYETDPVRTGLRFSIAFFAAITASLVVALYSSYTKTIRGPTVVAFLLFVLFYVLMATATTSSSTAIWAYPIFLGLGLGVCLTCLVTAAQLSAPPTLIAITSGLMISTRSLGGSVGYPIYNAIFNSKISKHLGPNIASAVLPLGLSPTVLPEFIAALTANDQKALMSIPGVTPQIIGAAVNGLQTAYLSAFRYVWVTAAVLCFVAALAACFLINPAKDLNMHVDAPLEDENTERQNFGPQTEKSLT